LTRTTGTRGGVALAVGVFVTSGWLGVGFGNHWDEHWIVRAWVRTLEEEVARAAAA